MHGSATARRPVWAGRRPVPLTPIVGREWQAAAVRDLVSSRVARLVTLTGPGGVGKTRLAIEVAATLEAGFEAVAFVPLAPVADAGLVAATIAQAVGLEASDEAAAGALTAHLRTGTMLLILDNVEHLPAVGPLLVELLGAVPGLTVLATSRASLHVSGEHRFPVPPLTLPDPGPLPPAANLDRFGAVHLFADRARAVRPAFVCEQPGGRWAGAGRSAGSPAGRLAPPRDGPDPVGRGGRDRGRGGEGAGRAAPRCGGSHSRRPSAASSRPPV
jgi:hypothetical protein